MQLPEAVAVRGLAPRHAAGDRGAERQEQREGEGRADAGGSRRDQERRGDKLHERQHDRDRAGNALRDPETEGGLSGPLAIGELRHTRHREGDGQDQAKRKVDRAHARQLLANPTYERDRPPQFDDDRAWHSPHGSGVLPRSVTTRPQNPVVTGDPRSARTTGDATRHTRCSRSVRPAPGGWASDGR